MEYNGILVPVRTSFGLRWRSGKMRMYQHKVDVNMLNAVKSVLADVSSLSLHQSKEDRQYWNSNGLIKPESHLDHY